VQLEYDDKRKKAQEDSEKIAHNQRLNEEKARRAMVLGADTIKAEESKIQRSFQTEPEREEERKKLQASVQEFKPVITQKSDRCETPAGT